MDPTGNIYVAGSTGSRNFPGVGAGSADSTLSGYDGFVAKLNTDLSSILAATFLGGGNSRMGTDQILAAPRSLRCRNDRF